MLNETIISPLVSGLGAENELSYVTAEGTQTDESFVSTLRALLHDRIGEHKLRFIQRSNMAKTAEEGLTPEEPESDTLTVIFFRIAQRDDVRGALTDEFEKIDELWGGWKKIKKITAFYGGGGLPVYCYANEEKRSSVVCVLRRADRGVYHYIQSCILAYLPWYFDVKAGITPLERRLLESLGKSTPDEYNACMEEYAELFNLREAGIRALVGDIEIRYEKAELERANNDLREVDRAVASYNEEIRQLFRRRRDLNVKILGLEARERDHTEESPLVGYFTRNKNAEVVDSDNDSITVAVRSRCTAFDTFAAERSIKNRRSFWYGRSGDLSDDDMELLARAIFLDQKLKINFCGVYRLYLSGGCDGVSGYKFGPKYAEYMPNPHIQQYSCIGDYYEDFVQAMTEGDLISAVDIAALSCASLNFEDHAVTTRFVEYLQGESSVNRRCIVLPDGSVVEPPEAVRYLKGE